MSEWMSDPAVLIATIMGGFLLTILGVFLECFGIGRQKTTILEWGISFNIVGIMAMGIAFYGIARGPGW